MERDKEAHRASIDELAEFCPPDVVKRLNVLHKKYCQRLDKELAKARRLVNKPYPVGARHDPTWLLVVYLTRTDPPGEQNSYEAKIPDKVRQVFGIAPIDGQC